eukprot:326831-Chlamydomonas_euryale.AAC.3
MEIANGLILDKVRTRSRRDRGLTSGHPSGHTPTPRGKTPWQHAAAQGSRGGKGACRVSGHTSDHTLLATGAVQDGGWVGRAECGHTLWRKGACAGDGCKGGGWQHPVATLHGHTPWSHPMATLHGHTFLATSMQQCNREWLRCSRFWPRAAAQGGAQGRRCKRHARGKVLGNEEGADMRASAAL